MRFLDDLALTALLGLSLALLTASMPAAIRPSAIGLFLAVYGIFTGITPLISGVEVARADYSTAVMITMLIITVIPLVVAALAYFLIPPRRQQTIQAATAGGQDTERTSSAP
jgi:MFS transporter, DHA2 family, multidrug resistance protein